MNEIIRRLGFGLDQVVPAAYVGAAAIVLKTKGLTNARTLHSWLYEPRVVYDYSKPPNYLNRYPTKLIFVKKRLPDNKRLICIDEAGSVPQSMKNDLLDTGRKIIACGDLNQLPPVMDNPAFLYTGQVHRLTKIMRQKEGSGIVYLANRILNHQPLEVGHYGDVYVCNKDDVSDDMLRWSDIVLCGYNKTRDHCNDYIRNMYGIDPKDKVPHHGEKIICRKNNWQFDIEGINLANGLSGVVSNYPDVSCYDGQTYKIDFKPNMFDLVFKGLKCNADFFRGTREEKEAIRSAKHTKGELFELGYAITTHISQGSQFYRGTYISEYMSPEINAHLDYTGITRFSQGCCYVLKRSKIW